MDITIEVEQLCTLARVTMLEDNWFIPAERREFVALMLTIKDIVGPSDTKRYEFLSALLGQPIISQRQPYFTKYRTNRLINILKENHDAAIRLHATLEAKLQTRSIQRAQDFYLPDEKGTSPVSYMLDACLECGGEPSTRVVSDEGQGDEFTDTGECPEPSHQLCDPA